MKKNYFNILIILGLINLSAIIFRGCMKEARAQNVMVTERLVNWVDTVVTAQIAPYTNAVIQYADSSNSTTDTFKVYLVSPAGDEVLAALTKVNDTTANSLEVTKKIGTVIPGDGTMVYYKVQCPMFYSIKVVRTNVASISGTAVTGKAAHVTIFAWSTSGSLDTEYKDLTFQDMEILSGYKNPGFY